MAVKLYDVLKSVIERNPDADKEELCRAFDEAANADPKLLRAVIEDVFDILNPIVTKKAAGEQLTKEKQAVLKRMDMKRLTKKEQALVDAYMARRHGAFYLSRQA